MHPKAELHKELQSTQIGPVADFAIWVPCLPAARCVNVLSSLPSNIGLTILVVTTQDAWCNMGHVGFGFSGTRIYEQNPKRTINILLKPTRQHSSIDSNLDMSCPPWPPVKTEKRLVFVDVPIEDQTGAFYIGTMTRLPEEDRFLTASEVAGLSTPVKDELISLYGGAEASSIAQATIREQLQNGDLQVP
ncbi:hypothetical protein FRC00_003653 [Tulasnella sp. 408]|nr:hypothetical protein FRC00_003653 [Tulasnella sp. 408]